MKGVVRGAVTVVVMVVGREAGWGTEVEAGVVVGTGAAWGAEAAAD